MKAATFPWGYYTRNMVDSSVSASLDRLRAYTANMLEDPLVRIPGRVLDLEGSRENAVLGGYFEFVYCGWMIENSVVVHVEDPDILDRLEYSTLPDEFVLSGNILPFPAMEFRFMRENTPAVCVLDFGHPGFKSFFNRHKMGDTVSMPVERDCVAVFTAADNPDEGDAFIAGKFINPEFPFLEQVRSQHKTFASPGELSRLERLFTYAMFSMLMGMEKAQDTGVRCRVPGINNNVGRKLKKRMNYKVKPPPMFRETTHYAYDTNCSETGKSRRGGWRKAHFRMLAHERFKRDEHGRPRIIPVAAAMVNGGGKTERTI